MMVNLYRSIKQLVFPILIFTSTISWGAAQPDLMVDDDNCFINRSFYSPFLVSDVYGPSGTESFEKNDRDIKIKIDSDHMISQFVTTEGNLRARLPRGSLVALSFSNETLSLENSQKESGYDFASLFSKLMFFADKAKSIPTRHQSYRHEDKQLDDKLNVTVLTVNEIYSRMQDSDISDKNIENGEIAYDVPAKSLIAINGESRLVAQEDFSFELPHLKHLKQTSKTISVTKDSYFKVNSTNPNEYQAYTCYEQNSNALNTKTYYLVEFFDAENKFHSTQFYINPFEVNFQGKVLPFLDSQVKSLLSVQGKLKRVFERDPKLSSMLISFDEINYQGFLRLPTFENEASGEEESLDEIKSYIHYGSEIDPLDSDDWGQASTVCGIMELSYMWKQYCDQHFAGRGCTLQIGDIAFPVEGFLTGKSGGSKWKKTRKGRRKSKVSKRRSDFTSSPSTGRDILGHRSHHEGTCVDIRPLRKDDEYDPTQIRSSNYDRQKTAAFIRMAKDYGATKRFFNDSKLIKQGLTERQAGHDDHIHICFEEKNFCD
jgi:hypothetical protein